MDTGPFRPTVPGGAALPPPSPACPGLFPAAWPLTVGQSVVPPAPCVDVSCDSPEAALPSPRGYSKTASQPVHWLLTQTNVFICGGSEPDNGVVAPMGSSRSVALLRPGTANTLTLEGAALGALSQYLTGPSRAPRHGSWSAENVWAMCFCNLLGSERRALCFDQAARGCRWGSCIMQTRHRAGAGAGLALIIRTKTQMGGGGAPGCYGGGRGRWPLRREENRPSPWAVGSPGAQQGQARWMPVTTETRCILRPLPPTATCPSSASDPEAAQQEGLCPTATAPRDKHLYRNKVQKNVWEKFHQNINKDV